MSSSREADSSCKCGGPRGRPVDPAKREAIVAAAAHSFFDIGYAATSIEQIAADAGVSKVTIYNQFGDKHTLFADYKHPSGITARVSLDSWGRYYCRIG